MPSWESSAASPVPGKGSRRSFSRHLWILLWKNWLLKRRTPITTLFEVALPVLIMAAIIGIRNAISSTDYGEQLHLSDALPFNSSVASDVSYFFLTYPKGDGAPNSEKLVFASDEPPAAVAPIIAAFTALYPALAASIVTSTPDAAQAYMKDSSYGIEGLPYYAAVLQLDSIGSAANGWQWAYTIRMNSTETSDDSTAGLPDLTSDAANTLHWVYDSSWTEYVSNGELLLQSFMDNYILQQALVAGGGSSSAWPQRQLLLQPMPTPPYIQDDFADTISTFLGLLFTVIFLWPVTRVIKLLVEEKETRIREGMLMMGLSSSTLWLSWLITYFVIFFLTSLIITLITADNVFQYSNKAFIFFFFLLAQLSFFSFCLLISALFSNSRIASTFGALIFLAIFFPYYAVFQDSVGTARKTVACLSPSLCMGLGVTNIIAFEGAQTGVNSGNSNTNLNNFSYSRTMGMLLLDFIWLLLLALYLEKVVPQQYGLRLPWYFPLQLPYWFPRRQQGGDAQQVSREEDGSGNMEPVLFADGDASQHQLGVRLIRLHKEFVTDRSLPPVVAVQKLSLSMYTGQILALLGHNGAGKTTTLSMLSGMTPPSSGDALVFGQSILTSMPSIRSTLGVCPQHNILFGLLTVQEHLELYACIKGVPRSDVKAAVEDMVAQVGLQDKLKVKSAALSGGMQRKLSVGIALIGDSRIVFLDEPTSGMDPYSRRATWDLLKKKKEGRVIILTTHFMDEADHLGDRIAIMAAGQLQCCGSSLFLKTRFGVGYSMTIVKEQHCREAELQQAISDHVPDAQIVNNVAGELSYKLPLAASPAFPDMFDLLDTRLRDWGVQSYGISVTTLEEVFLRVGKDAEAAAKIHGRSQGDLHAQPASPGQAEMSPLPHRVDVQAKRGWVGSDEAERTAAEEKEGLGGPGLMAMSSPSGARPELQHVLSSSALSPTARMEDGMIGGRPVDALGAISFDHSHRTRRHIRALLIKRLQNAKRNKKNWCWTIIIPFLVMIVFLGTTKDLQAINVPDTSINLSQYNTPNIVDFSSPQPQVLQTVSGGSQQVQLVNLTAAVGSNVTAFAEYLYDSSYSLQLSRYGALMYNVSLGPTLQDSATILFNTSGIYALPAFFNLYNTALLRAITGSPTATISLNFWGFPETESVQTLYSSLNAIIIGIAFAFIPANFVYFAVKESAVKSKHQQLISGVRPWAYWLANFMFDMLNYLVPAALCLLALAIYDVSQLIGSNTGATVIALLLYGLSVIPFAAFCSFLFRSPTSAQNIMLIFFIIIGAFLLVLSVVLDIIPSTQNINKSLKFVYRLLPTYCFCESIVNLIDRSTITVFTSPQSLFAFDVVGWDFIFMAWEAAFYTALVMLVEYVQASPALFTFFTRSGSGGIPTLPADEGDEDDDVKAERARLQSASKSAADPITMLGLRKVYPSHLGVGPKVAVKDLWLGVHDGECLGFLGTNGAGKTSTMKMLTNDLYPTSGDALLSGMSILTHQQQIKEKVGYCFAESDTRVLTNRGLLFLDEIEALQAEREELLFGCYEEQSKRLLYSKGKLVFPPQPPPYLVDFTSAGEAARWAEGSDCGVEGAADDNSQSCHVSLRVTPGHDMYVQLGDAGVNGGTVWSSTRGRCDPATGSRPHAVPETHRKVQAQNLLSGDARACVRMLACAEAGYAPQAITERHAVQDELRLDNTQFAAFLELLGFWLADGSLSYSPAVNGSAAGHVSFGQVKQTELSWLRRRLEKVGLKEDEYLLSGSSGIDTTLHITEPAWFAFFDKEFGSSWASGVQPKAEKSVQHLPDWTLRELPAAEMRLLISGLHRADGSFVGAMREICTSSACFRDQLMQALLHCGYSAYAVLIHGDTWKVSWADLDSVHNTAAADSCWPSMSRQQCVTRVPYHAERDGRTWCVAVEHADHLIIAQRAQRSPDCRTVTKQSQPIVVGNCPQFDALMSTLTAREHLYLFARIKGVKEALLPGYVQSMIDRLGLQAGIADRPCKGYSGGNKRKLCVGIALIGNPPIVFLDEPSTGMDPASRRFMWDFISQTMRGRSVILTTHSMEEAEALCQRIAIMVGGSLRCLGNAQRLKSLYGDGYQLAVTIAPDQLPGFQQEMSRLFPACRVVESLDTLLKYEMPKLNSDGSRVSIGSVFRLMEQLKIKYGVREYAVSETDLEQIFLRHCEKDRVKHGDQAHAAAGSAHQYEPPV